ncbi:MAG TPA: hypothetical protein DIU07_10840 [Rhodobacteraceae bacterium]|nr:hypothetical protein [Paracoccaceae bacterium]
MSNTSERVFSCRGICWVVGVLVGIVAAILITGVWGLIVGVAVAVALALVLQRLFCTDVAAASATGSVSTQDASAAAAGGAATAASGTPAGAAADAEAARAAADAEAARAEAEAAPAAAKAEAEAEAARVAAAAEAAQAKADAEADAALAAMPEPGAKDYDGDGVIEGEAEGTRPEALTAARGGQADDLKLIKGIGPKLEQLCNELGFFHWDQIANWSADEVAWVNANLKGFKGRVSRDNWLEQAKTLAAGGTTEFAQRAEKSGLYDGDKS